MKRRFLAFGLALIFAAGAIALSVLLLHPSEPDGDRSAKRPSLDEAIERASDYLVRHCDDQGRFVYRVNLDPDVDVIPRYNMLRHAGTIYALAESQRRRPSEKKLATLQRAVEFMRSKTIAPIPGQKDMLAVWSRPEINEQSIPYQAKLGGTGLGLVALLNVERVAPGTVSLDELRALGRFLVYMQRPDGSFYSKYFPNNRGRDGQWQSLYYPGEAALGLLMLYEIDPQPIWLETATAAIAYLARSGRNVEVVEPDHWVLLAMARLWPVCDKCRPPLPCETIVRHAKRICRRMLEDRRQLEGKVASLGCFTPDGRTCPTATRVEGLTAALTFLPDEETDLRKDIHAAVGQAVDFLMESQVAEGPYSGGIPRAVSLPKSDSPSPLFTEDEGEADRRTEIRMDYVQHAISAMIQWEQLQDKRPRQKAEPRP